MVNYKYRATVSRIVDGDTLFLHVQLGFRLTAEVEFRMNGLNTPEVVGSNKTAGLAAKAELTRLLGLGEIYVQSTKSDKYGRWLATVFVKQANGNELNVNEHLLNNGFALPYDGKGAKPE
jgi:micrococcal nuclease